MSDHLSYSILGKGFGSGSGVQWLTAKLYHSRKLGEYWKIQFAVSPYSIVPYGLILTYASSVIDQLQSLPDLSLAIAALCILPGLPQTTPTTVSRGHHSHLLPGCAASASCMPGVLHMSCWPWCHWGCSQHPYWNAKCLSYQGLFSLSPVWRHWCSIFLTVGMCLWSERWLDMVCINSSSSLSCRTPISSPFWHLHWRTCARI